MIKLTSTTRVAVVAALIGGGSLASSEIATAPRASAVPGSMSSPMPLSSQWRACDFSKLAWVSAVGDARAVAHVGTNGSGVVVATVDVATALPNTRYDVRVIQTPRSSLGCAPGAPGVLTGAVQTDGLGAGSTTLGGQAADGATGAWVIVERPSGSSQTPAEFYTSEFIASI
jgi:hypothetical protein